LAKLEKRDQEIDRLKRKLDEKEKKEGIERIKEIERKRDEIQMEYQQGMTLMGAPDVDYPIFVMSRDDRFMGYLYQFAQVENNGNIAVLASSLPNGKGRIWECFQAKSWKALVRNAENLKQQIKAGYIVLNRFYDGGYGRDEILDRPIIEGVSAEKRDSETAQKTESADKSNSISCPQCGKKFNKPTSLAGHLRGKHAKES